MPCTEATKPHPVREERIPLEQLDDATLRAMADGGWLHHRDYVAIAQARGVLVSEVSPPPASRSEGAFLIMLPASARPHGTVLANLQAALRPLGGRILAALDQPAPGGLTLPALDTRMQHQRPREAPTTSIA